MLKPFTLGPVWHNAQGQPYRDRDGIPIDDALIADAESHREEHHTMTEHVGWFEVGGTKPGLHFDRCPKCGKDDAHAPGFCLIRPQ